MSIAQNNSGYFGWYNDQKKLPVHVKIAEAVEAYQSKHGRAPGVCLVGGEVMSALCAEEQKPEVGEVKTPLGTLGVRAVSFLRPGYFLLGEEK